MAMGKYGPIETRLLINGKLVESSDKKTFPIFNPATKEKVVDVFEASEEDTNAAVEAAKAAAPAWAKLSPNERGKYFKKLAALLRQSHDELAYLEAISMGRPVSTYFEPFWAAGEFDYYAEAGMLAHGETSLHIPGFVNMTLRQPYGVAAAIIPWNFPLIFFTDKAAPALMAGNTLVLKSSEKAPLTCAKVAALVEEAGFPPGVFNIITGYGQLSGAILSSHMDIRMLSFTGSVRTGRQIQIASAKSNLKNLLLELGGKAPAIIFEDADISQAVADTRRSIQMNSGQMCMANSRIYVHESIADSFIQSFKEKFAAVNAGDPTVKETNHGPQADEIQYRSVMQYIEEGKKTGTLLLGGKTGLDSGYFIEPTIFTNTAEDAKIVKEEIFGPVVVINTFKTEEEVTHKANDTEYGLYASVYTKNLDRAMRMAKAIESGVVAINTTSPMKAVDLPYGGYKSSGIGRESRNTGLSTWLETKTVVMKVENL